jgi:hypothetical protein
MSNEFPFIQLNLDQREPTQEQVLKSCPHLMDPAHYLSPVETLSAEFDRSTLSFLSNIHHLDGADRDRILDFFSQSRLEISKAIAQKIELDFAGFQHAEGETKPSDPLKFVASSQIRDAQKALEPLESLFLPIEHLTQAVLLLRSIDRRWDKIANDLTRLQDRLVSAQAHDEVDSPSDGVDEPDVETLPKSQRFEILARQKRASDQKERLENLQQRLAEKDQRRLVLEADFKNLSEQIRAFVAFPVALGRMIDFAALSSLEADPDDIPNGIVHFREGLRRILNNPHQEFFLTAHNSKEIESAIRRSKIFFFALLAILGLQTGTYFFGRSLFRPHANSDDPRSEKLDREANNAGELLEKLRQKDSALAQRKIPYLQQPTFNRLITNEQRYKIFSAINHPALLRIVSQILAEIKERPEIETLSTKEIEDIGRFLDEQTKIVHSELDYWSAQPLDGENP